MKLPIRVLVLCTGNSARSQIAEALFRHRGVGRVEPESAGSDPTGRVHQGAFAVLRRHGVPSDGLRSKGMEEVIGDAWDLVITVCDHARDVCPVSLGEGRKAHWGVADPVGAGSEAEAFERAHDLLREKVDRLLALDLGAIGPEELERKANRIGSGL